MGLDAIIVLGVILLAIILFVWDKFSIDLIALIILTSLALTGVLTPQESLSGFSNSATLTVAFMFVLSNAQLKTRSLQRIGPKLSEIFYTTFNLGILLMIIFVGVCSAFVNNTPIVAMFIPVLQSIAHQTRISPSKQLIPLSYASIFGGTCTLIGTSTNILVSGIAEENGLSSFSIFLSTPIGLVFLIVGATYLFLYGKNKLPERESNEESGYGFRDYLTEIERREGSQLVGKSIIASVFHRDIEVDIIEVRRTGKLHAEVIFHRFYFVNVAANFKYITLLTFS
jgi:di/tricarboxylate transporter